MPYDPMDPIFIIYSKETHIHKAASKNIKLEKSKSTKIMEYARCYKILGISEKEWRTVCWQ